MLPIKYTPDFFPKDVANDLFTSLWNELDWVDVAGPRREYYVNSIGVPYTYGRDKFARTYEPQPDHSAIKWIREKLEEHVKTKFEVCFLNGYRDGKDHLGWHADDSPEMDDERPIAIVSLGAAREIWFRKNPSKCYACNGSGKYDSVGSPPCGACEGSGRESQDVIKQRLGHGSLCLMLSGMQDTHQHRIPKSDQHDCPPRVSLTFRGYVK